MTDLAATVSIRLRAGVRQFKLPPARRLRPLLLMAALLLGTMAVQRFSRLPSATLCWSLLAAASLAWLRFGAKSWVATLCWAAVSLAVAALHAGDALTHRWPDHAGRPTIVLIGTVDGLVQQHDRSASFVLLVERAIDAPPAIELPRRVRVSWYGAGIGQALPRGGERWQLAVQLKSPRGPVNPAGFDAELGALRAGVDALGSVKRGVVASSGEQPSNRRVARVAARPGAWVDRLRETVRHNLRLAAARAGFDPQGAPAGLLIALAVGDQAALPAAQWNSFNRLGISHLIAISGVHITMLAALAAWLTGRLWRTPLAGRAGWALRLPLRNARWIAALLAAFGYSLLAGWGIPAQRTCWMLAAPALAALVGSRGAGIDALGLALLAVLICDPMAPSSASFWLSFCATAALIGATPRPPPAATHRPPAPAPGALQRCAVHLRAAIGSQWVATIALLPLGALFFGMVSLLAPLANLIAIPLISGVLTPVTLLCTAFLMFGAQPPAVLIQQCLALAQAVVAGADALAQWPWAALNLPRMTTPALIAAVCGAAMLLRAARRRWKTAGAVALIVALSGTPARPEFGQFRLLVFDVGDSVAVALITRRHALLYVGALSRPGQLLAITRVAWPALQAAAVARIDRLIVTRATEDMAALRAALPHAELLSARTRRVGASTTDHDGSGNGAPDSDSSEAAPADRGASADCPSLHDWSWDGVDFEWMAIATQNGRPPAASSACALRVSIAGSGALLMSADFSTQEEKRLVRDHAERLGARAVLIARHGARGAAPADWLDAAQPTLAIASVAAGNRYNHPDAAVLERLAERHVELVRTDRDGAIDVLFDSRAERLWHAPRRWRHAERPYWRIDGDR